MIITKEQQEAWVSNYIKEKHTQDECIGFIDGVEKVLEVVGKNSGEETITLTKTELECLLEDWEKGNGCWSDTSRRIVRFLGMDETAGT